jgi:acetoin utilization deacetylase AcuC-like enzyme
MEKYRKLRERVEARGLAEGLVPDAATDADLVLAHDAEYVGAVASGALTPPQQRALGFPWSSGLVERSRRSVGGTTAAARAALAGPSAIAASLAGGTHHASRGRGEGFCVFNDVAVAARVLQRDGLARRVLVVDCDVHQGNGTAAIFAGDPSVFTLSLHGARNYPLRKERSSLDVELADGTGDDEYLARLGEALAAAFGSFDADVAFYLAGADPLAGDRLGRLALTKDGLARRDALAIGRCAREGVPVAVVMAGGYAPDVDDVVDVHLRTIEIAASLGAAA